MNIHGATPQHLSTALKKQYQQLLLPFERFRRGLDPPPARLQLSTSGKSAGGGERSVGSEAANSLAATNGTPSGHSVEHQSSGGSLMSRRVSGGVSNAEMVTIQAAKGEERSNGLAFDEVIAYEPPKPGEEVR